MVLKHYHHFFFRTNTTQKETFTLCYRKPLELNSCGQVRNGLLLEFCGLYLPCITALRNKGHRFFPSLVSDVPDLDSSITAGGRLKSWTEVKSVTSYGYQGLAVQQNYSCINIWPSLLKCNLIVGRHGVFFSRVHSKIC